MKLTAEQRSDLERLARRLEDEVQSRGEMVLSSMEWELDGPNEGFDPNDPYAGLTPEFLALIDELCDSKQAWINLYVALLVELAGEGELRKRFVKLSDRLWMKTLYRGRAIWHTAFPPLDGGGSSQARVFYQYLRKRFAQRTFGTCFEWCSGPGFLGFVALWEGLCEELVLADINPGIAPGIERTIKENGLQGRVRYYVSDNLKQVPKEEKFDLVLGNPPWAYREIPDLPNPLIPNDPEWRIHREFFQQISEHLNPEAELCISAYEPFRQVAYIEHQKEPWDIRPRPPILDFREFLGESGFVINEVYRALPDPQVSYGGGMSLFLIEQREAEQTVLPDLIGLGGSPVPRPAEAFQFDLTVVRGLPLGQMVQHSQQMDALRTGVSQTLVEKHLAGVLKDLFETPEAAPPHLLHGLGIPPEIASALPDWDNPEEFLYQPPVAGLRLAPESCRQPVKKIRMQVGQDAPVSIGLRTLQALLKQLPTEIEFCVLVKPGFQESPTRRFLEDFEGYSSHRVTFFEHGHQTLFAQDNGRLALLPDQSSAILVPGYLSMHRPADVLMAAPLPLVRSRLHWEGGNILCDGHRVLVGANSIAANMRAFGLTREQVMRAFEAEMGYSVVVLGDVEAAFLALVNGERGGRVSHAVDGGQADFHIDLDCCLLGRATGSGAPRAVLADPERGLSFLPEVLKAERLFQGHCVSPLRARALYQRGAEDSVIRRAPILDRYSASLTEAGYEVHRVPDLRLVSDLNYLGRSQTMFSYCNALPLQLHQRSTVALLTCEMAELESEVRRVYAELGVDVMWVGDRYMAEDLLSMRGGLHCFCSVME